MLCEQHNHITDQLKFFDKMKHWVRIERSKRRKKQKKMTSENCQALLVQQKITINKYTKYCLCVYQMNKQNSIFI